MDGLIDGWFWTDTIVVLVKPRTDVDIFSKYVGSPTWRLSTFVSEFRDGS